MTDTPVTVPLVGKGLVADLLRERVSKNQVPNLIHSGVLGTRYSYSGAMGSTPHVLVALAEVHRWRDAPNVDIPALLAVAGVALVARQVARTPVVAEIDDSRDWMGVDLHAPEHEQILAVDRWWNLGTDTRDRLREGIAAAGGVPLVSSVSGAVALCRTITAVPIGGGPVALETTEPGDWAEDVHGRWLRLGPGRDWVLLTAPRP